MKAPTPAGRPSRIETIQSQRDAAKRAPVYVRDSIPRTIEVSREPGKNALGIPAIDDSGEIRSLEAMEADMIRLALGRYRGHMTEVAKRLNIGRSTLYRKMRDYGLEGRLN